MPTPASDTALLVPDVQEDPTASPNRLDIKKEVVEKMKGATKLAIVALGIAAQATQNVPYLGAISTALTELMKIQDEVDQCKDECKAVMVDAGEMNVLINGFREKCDESGRGDGVLNGSLCKEFAKLERVVLECILTLQKCKIESKRRRDRLRLRLKRAELAKSVKDCSSKMGKALQHFNTTLQVDQVIILQEIRLAVNELREARSSTQQVDVPTSPSAWPLRSAPRIFYGRESEVDHAIDLIMHQAPARVAILGSGGIGKTSIALSVLHRPEVEALYGDQRCFLSCEATTTADAVIHALADALSIELDKDFSIEAAQRHLLSSLKSATGIICLDNLETPWDADTAAVESLLIEIASLPSIALLITSRVTDTPLLGWSSPPLAPIAPFSVEAALQTWDAICSTHDEYSVKLIEAVDCVPLAVTLLARLARNESAKIIWTRWEREHTKLIRTHGVGHRLNNLDISIELSLQALESRDAIDILNIICIFPDGIWDSDLSTFDEALQGRLSVRRAVTLLKQLSLLHTATHFGDPDTKIIYVLSPIRHYMQQHHHVSDELFLTLADAMLQDRYMVHWDDILKFGLNRQGPCCERCLHILISDDPDLLILDVALVSHALERARSFGPQMLSRLHRKLGFVLRLNGEYDQARSSFSEAIELDVQLGDREALFADWIHWIFTLQWKFGDRPDQCQDLDEVQNAIRKTWRLGRNDDQVWDKGLDGYFDLARAQNHVNNGRRKLRQPVVYRSGLFTGNDSTEFLGDTNVELSYSRLVATSPPPWDLPVIIESLKP